MKEIKKIVNGCPRASFKNPTFRQNSEGDIIVTLGSPADACRVIDALRGKGYDCNLASQYSPSTVKVIL